jgi:SCY1-like protein 2
VQKEWIKRDVEFIDNHFRREVQLMTRLRHPSILHIQDALVDLKVGKAYCAEPIQCSLLQMIKSNHQIQIDSLDEIEIQSGLTQLCNGLDFLHKNDIVMVGMAPDSIFINQKGDWKLGGFHFALKVNERPEILDFPPFCDLELGFFAPETVLEHKAMIKSDVFGLGSLICAIFNSGTPGFTSGSVTNYQQNLQSIKVVNVPFHLERIVKEMVSIDHTFRPDLNQFMKSDYFQTSLMNTINYMEQFLELNPVEKAQFLKTLPTTLQQFSFKTVTKKILQILLEELKNSQMAPFVLPSVFWITERCSNNEFTETILPVLQATAFQIKEPPQTALLTLSRLDLLSKKTEKHTFTTHILPFLMNCLATKNHVVQSQASKMVPKVLEYLDFVSIKTMVLPKIEALFLASSDAVGQGNALMALKAMIPFLDKATVVERYLPLFDRKYVEPAVVLLYATVLKDISPHLDSTTLSSKIIPTLWTLSSGKISLLQFEQISVCIDDLTRLVRSSRTIELKEQEALQGIF